MGEGAFSDEIRSRGRSEFGYLIRERGVKERGDSGNKDGAGVRGALSRSSSLFRPQLRCLQNGITQDPALQTALYSTPPPRPLRPPLPFSSLRRAGTN